MAVKTKAQLEAALAAMTARAEAAEAAQGPQLKADPADRPEEPPATGIARVLRGKWFPAVWTRAVGPLILGLIIGGTIVLLDQGGEKTETDVESNFFDLIAHLPTIGLILLISLAADYIAKWVMSQTWFDQHGSAQELGTVRDRIGTPDERPQDGLSAGLGFIGNRLFAAAVALALLLHFG